MAMLAPSAVNLPVGDSERRVLGEPDTGFERLLNALRIRLLVRERRFFLDFPSSPEADGVPVLSLLLTLPRSSLSREAGRKD